MSDAVRTWNLRSDDTGQRNGGSIQTLLFRGFLQGGDIGKIKSENVTTTSHGPGFVATAVKPWIRFAKRALPAGSCRQLRFMGREQVQLEQGALHEPTPSPLPGGEPETAAANKTPLLGGTGGGFMDRAQFFLEQAASPEPSSRSGASVERRHSWEKQPAGLCRNAATPNSWPNAPRIETEVP